MPVTVSSAEATWSGDLISGEGAVRPASGAFPEVPVSWGRRTQREAGTTSPEEMLASAHAACFCMALSNELAKAQMPPERLRTTAQVTFETGRADGAAITGVKLEVVGRVPGADSQAFENAARAAGAGCPVSKALSVPVEVSARLE